jgi:hypothetical protein
MVEHGLNPLLINIDCHLEVSIRASSHKFFLKYIYNYIYKVFIGISGEKFEIHFVAIGYIDFEKGFK